MSCFISDGSREQLYCVCCCVLCESVCLSVMCLYVNNIFHLSAVDPSVLYQIIDYLDKHPEVVKVESYFDCALIYNYKINFVTFCFLCSVLLHGSYEHGKYLTHTNTMQF